MSKVFVKGDTISEGLEIQWIDSDTQERTVETVEFNDYFYVKLDDFYKLKDDLNSKFRNHIAGVYEKKAKDEFNEEETFAKITLKNNLYKHYIRQFIEDECQIQTFEADLNTIKRYLVDTHQTLKLNLLDSPYLFYDLETDDRNNFRYDEYNKVIPENTILSFSGVDHNGKTFFFINEDSENPECEKQLLIKIGNLFKQYSVVAGWNSDVFDDIYLQGRCKVHGLQDITEQVNNLDFMFSYKKFRIEVSLDSYSLDNVAEVELNEKKVDVKKGGGRLYNLYLTDKEKLKEYNIQDTMLLYRLNQKLKFIELHLQTAEYGHCNVQLTKYNIGSNDYFILMQCKERNLIAPSNPTKEEKERRRRIGGIGGGYTRGVPGLYKNVATYDFSSLYPSLEITYNISPETFVENVTIEEQKHLLEKKDQNIKVFKDYEELKAYAIEKNYIFTPADFTYVAKSGREIYHPYRLYKGDEIGLLPSIMIGLLKDRMDIKKDMKSMNKGTVEYDRAYNKQLALKYMLNSSYGLNALPAYRFFRWDVADSITTSGRVNTKKIREFAENNGFNVVYSDTDSVGVAAPKNMTYEETQILFSEFDKNLVEYIDNEILKDLNNKIYEREDKYGKHNHRLILEWEKTYNILLYKKKKRYAGLIGDKVDVKGLRSTQMNVLASKLQDDLIEDILKEQFNEVDWKNKMDELYEKCITYQIEAENLTMSKRFTARASEQKAPRAHTLLAERLIEQGFDVAVGDKIKYIVESDKPKQHAVTVEEFNINKKYPAEYYWDIFTKPLISLMGVVDEEMAFRIIKIPDLIKYNIKLNKETDDDKKIKLMTRISDLKDKLLDKKKDEMESEDHLFSE